jgi:hypothetical protein
MQSVPFKLNVAMIIYRISDDASEISLEKKCSSAHRMLHQPTFSSVRSYVRPGIRLPVYVKVIDKIVACSSSLLKHIYSNNIARRPPRDNRKISL